VLLCPQLRAKDSSHKMFSKDLAKKSSAILSTTVENELIALFDELIAKDDKQLSPTMSDRELLAAVARLELLRRLKNYKKFLEDSLRHAS
jgi:hypothetical protein